MGNVAAGLKSYFKPRECRLTLVGLDAAGKTTILYRLHLGEAVTTIPTIGFNVETIPYKSKVQLVLWDIGGRDKSKPILLRHYAPGSDAIVACVDSSDRERMGAARELLQDVLSTEGLQGVPLLVYANKQDISGSMTAKEVEEALQLNTLKDRPYHVVGCCAVKGEGLWEGIEWVARQLNKEALSSSISSPMKETIEDGQTMLSSSSSWLSWLLCAGSKKDQQRESEEEQEFLAQRSSVTTT